MNLKAILLILLVYFTLILTTYHFYSNYLFENSFLLIKQLQQMFNKDQGYFYFFFYLMSSLCFVELLIPFMSIISIFISLSKFFILISILLFINYIDCILKIIYLEPRPFWIDKNLFLNGSCEGGYGNPSGHAIISSSFWLIFFKYLTETNIYKKFKENKISHNKFIEYLIIPLIIFVVFMIMLSRLYLAVHSLNQILLGFLIGIGLFYFFTYVFNPLNLKDEELLSIFSQNIISFCSILIILLIVPIVLWLKINDPKEDIYRLILKEKCPNLTIYRTLKEEGLVGCLLILGILGGYFGFLFLNYSINKNKENKKLSDCNVFTHIIKVDCNNDSIISWQNDNIFNRMIRILCLIPFILLPALLFIIIPKTSSLFVILTFKISIPIFLLFFLIFGPFIYYSYELCKYLNGDKEQINDENDNIELEYKKFKEDNIN